MMYRLFGKKMNDDQRKINLKIKLNQLVTSDIKCNLWLKYYNDNFKVYCYQCKRREIDPFQCYWIHLNFMDHNMENNVIPVCKTCNVINDRTIFI